MKKGDLIKSHEAFISISPRSFFSNKTSAEIHVMGNLNIEYKRFLKNVRWRGKEKKYVKR